MNHEAHVRLVDAHAEGVGRRNRAQVAPDEALLHVLLGLGRHSGVEVLGRHLLQLQERRHLLATPARRAVDNGAARGIRRQAGLQHLADMGELLAARGWHYREVEIVALGAAVEDGQLDTQLVAKVADDVLASRPASRVAVRQSSGGIGSVAGLLADEAAHVAVVGAEVVAPAREAMRLVQHPAADLALVQRPAQGAAAQLLRRDQEDARRAAETHALQRVERARAWRACR